MIQDALLDTMPSKTGLASTCKQVQHVYNVVLEQRHCIQFALLSCIAFAASSSAALCCAVLCCAVLRCAAAFQSKTACCNTPRTVSIPEVNFLFLLCNLATGNKKS